MNYVSSKILTVVKNTSVKGENYHFNRHDSTTAAYGRLLTTQSTVATEINMNTNVLMGKEIGYSLCSSIKRLFAV